MTCIAAWADIKTQTVWLGADSAGTSGSGHQEIRVDPKIFNVGDAKIAICGSFRLGNILRYFIKTPDSREALGCEDDFEYMVRHFIPAMRAALNEHGGGRKVSEVETSTGEIIVARKGKFFAIDIDYQVAELDSLFYATGSGGKTALGALHVTRDVEMEPIERLLRALDASARWNSGVAGPFLIESHPCDGSPGFSERFFPGAISAEESIIELRQKHLESQVKTSSRKRRIKA